LKDTDTSSSAAERRPKVYTQRWFMPGGWLCQRVLDFFCFLYD